MSSRQNEVYQGDGQWPQFAIWRHHDPELSDALTSLLPVRHTYPCREYWTWVRMRSGLEKPFPQSFPGQCHLCTMQHAANYVMQEETVDSVTWLVIRRKAATSAELNNAGRRLRRQAADRVRGFRISHWPWVTYFIAPSQAWVNGPPADAVALKGDDLARLITDISEPDGHRNSHRVRPLAGSDFDNSMKTRPPSDNACDSADGGQDDSGESMLDFALEDTGYYTTSQEETNMECEEEMIVNEIRRDESWQPLSDEEEQLVQDASWCLDDARGAYPAEVMRLILELAQPRKVHSPYGRFLGYWFNEVADAKRALALDTLGPYLNLDRRLHDHTMRLPPRVRTWAMGSDALDFGAMRLEMKAALEETAKTLRDRFS